MKQNMACNPENIAREEVRRLESTLGGFHGSFDNAKFELQGVQNRISNFKGWVDRILTNKFIAQPFKQDLTRILKRMMDVSSSVGKIREELDAVRKDYIKMGIKHGMDIEKYDEEGY